MLCPMKLSQDSAEYGYQIELSYWQCHQEKCAWWLNKEKMCAVKAIPFWQMVENKRTAAESNKK